MCTSTVIVFLACVSSAMVLANGEASNRRCMAKDSDQCSRINQQQALSVINAAVRKAQAICQPMSIAVVDSSGRLVAYFRMDNSWLVAKDIAIKKAKTCARFSGTSTETLYPAGQPGGQLYGIQETNGGLVFIGGGLSICKSSTFIGCIGVAGGNVTQDVAVANAGADAVN